MPKPAPEYVAEKIGSHAERLQIRIGGDLFEVDLAAAIAQIYAREPEKRKAPARVIPFPTRP